MISISRKIPKNPLIRFVLHLTWIVLLLDVAVVNVAAQASSENAARPDRGAMPNGSFAVTDIENINLTNGALNLSIPLASLPPIAGGKLSLGVRANYSSKIWDVDSTEMQLAPISGCAAYTSETPRLSLRGGWRIVAGYTLEFRDAHEDFDYHVPAPPGPSQDCEEDTAERAALQYQYYRLILTSPDGSEHELRRIKSYYEDSELRTRVESDLRAENDGVLKARETRDQLGRIILSEHSEDGSTHTISSQTAYEQMGKIVFMSNPSRGTVASTDGWTRAKKDNLGRVIEMATFAGATQPTPSSSTWNGRVQTTYDANVTTVEDQAGKQRRSVTDAIGRLIEVIEAPNESSYNFSTTYVYDVLNNLRRVTQGSQNPQKRYFLYDSLSRLIRARNPELGVHSSLNMSSDSLTENNSQWSMGYAYDANGNLISRTDTRNITTTYDYDGLDRVKLKQYSDSTPDVAYLYDSQALPSGAPTFNRGTAIGRLVATLYGTVSGGTFSGINGSYLGYDTPGRVVRSRQITDSVSYDFPSYAYDLSDNLVSQTYPTGRVVTNNFNLTGGLASISGQASGAAPKTYVNSIGYTANGASERMRLGNGRWEHNIFNNRMQLTEIGLGASATDSSMLKLNYDYGTTANNGNVLRQVITVPTIGTATGFTATQHYQYDQLNRLTGSQEVSGGTSSTWQTIGFLWQQKFTYDQFGNRSVDTNNTTSTMIGPNPVISASTNRITPRSSPVEYYAYDSSGNLTAEKNGETLSYNAENKMVTN